MTKKNRILIESPSEDEVKKAICTIITSIGDDPERESLLETPNRIIKSYAELFAGYRMDPNIILGKTFKNINCYEDMILLKDINFTSMCEHHMLPIIGTANIAYIPDKKIVGISKLARITEAYARRLQIQENMTVQIAESIQKHLEAKGVAVSIDAEHLCMTSRGVNKSRSIMTTSHYTGDFFTNESIKKIFSDKLNK
jgi:GTP cyclohydrolase IA